MARVDDCIDKIGPAKYVTKLDLLKGYWQIPLTERAKKISAFVVLSGLYQYKVMPFDRGRESDFFISEKVRCWHYVPNGTILSVLLWIMLVLILVMKLNCIL
jgi:hypothetical protein